VAGRGVLVSNGHLFSKKKKSSKFPGSVGIIISLLESAVHGNIK